MLNLIEKKFSNYKAAYLLIAIFVILFFFLSLGRHYSLKSYLNDLGTYDQVIWNSSQGRFFDNSANMLGERNYLGAHFSPILLVFVPFYWIFPSISWLLFFQALAVGLSALPIYFFARDKLKRPLAGIIFLLSYLLYPLIHNGVLYDFHEVIFALPFASFTFYFLEKKNDKWFIFFSVLLSLSQEHLSLLVLMMGLYAMFIQKRWKWGIYTAILSLAYFLLAMFLFIPSFSSTGDSALISSGSQYVSRYSWLGSSFPEILKNIVSHPLAILKVLFSAERVIFIFILVFPLFSLSLYSWPALISFPILIVNFLSEKSMPFNANFYHSAIIAPFLFFSAILTMKRWFAENYPLQNLFFGLIMAFSLIASYILGVTPFSYDYKLSDYIPNQHAKKIEEIKKIIPPGSSLSIQHNLGPHFSQRKELYRFPLEIGKTQYVVVDKKDPYGDSFGRFFNFRYALQLDFEEWENKIKELESGESYEKIYDSEGYLVFKLKDS